MEERILIVCKIQDTMKSTKMRVMNNAKAWVSKIGQIWKKSTSVKLNEIQVIIASVLKDVNL